MKSCKMYYSGLLIALMLLSFSSCTNNAAKADEEEVHIMDSVSKNLEKTAKELEAQNEKLEASLEKLDKELANAE